MKKIYETVVLSLGAFARAIRIYSPKKADRAVIMHDGQNVFCDEDAAFGKSWRAADLLKASGIKNTAIIGIDCAPTRNDDYLPFVTRLSEYGVKDEGGKADKYVEYIERIVVPYLDKRFGYKSYAMLGSSAGANATLYFAARRNERFIAYGMYSTPLFISPDDYAEFLDAASFDENAFYHVYSGGNEDDGEANENWRAKQHQLFTDDAFALVNGLRRGGAKKIRLDFDNTAIHDETSWRIPEKIFLSTFSKM